MATSNRPRPSEQASRQSRAPARLPPYQAPAHPLNEAAQRALHILPSAHKLDKLKHHLQKSVAALTENAGHINDCYQAKSERQQKRKARRAQQGIEDDEDDSTVDEMKAQVDEMTERMEVSVRKIIDAQAAVEGAETALKEVGQNLAAGGGGTLAPTQSTLGASQFRQRRRRRGVDLDEDDSDFDDAASQAEDQENAGISGLLSRKIAEQRSRYDNLTMRDRYAANNDYVGFKRTIHDALHPGDDAPPMPNASTWFPESPRTMNTTTRNAGRQPADAEDDDDIDVLSERISIKCPITLVPMKDPVSSTKCPHSFEKSAILDMLNQSVIRVGGSNRRGAQNGLRAVKCPVCEMMLTATDLHTDPVLVRKIKRIQAAQLTRDNDSDDDGRNALPRGTQRQQPEEIGDENGDDIDRTGFGARPSFRTPRVKSEQVASSARQQSMIPNTQPPPSSTADIVDLEDPDEEEDGIVDLEGSDEEDEE